LHDSGDHWEFNPQNWNALAGFLKYLPWDSTRLTVEESTVQHGQRVLVWKSKAGQQPIQFLGRKAGDEVSITVQPQSFEFWIGS
jgi:hypothetical protein